jgi:hypothetical protein
VSVAKRRQRTATMSSGKEQGTMGSAARSSSATQALEWPPSGNRRVLASPKERDVTGKPEDGVGAMNSEGVVVGDGVACAGKQRKGQSTRGWRRRRRIRGEDHAEHRHCDLQQAPTTREIKSVASTSPGLPPNAMVNVRPARE